MVATRLSPGAISESSSSHLPPIEASKPPKRGVPKTRDNLASFRRDLFKMTFASSNPPDPARQFVSNRARPQPIAGRDFDGWNPRRPLALCRRWRGQLGLRPYSSATAVPITHLPGNEGLAGGPRSHLLVSRLRSRGRNKGYQSLWLLAPQWSFPFFLCGTPLGVPPKELPNSIV